MKLHHAFLAFCGLLLLAVGIALGCSLLEPAAPVPAVVVESRPASLSGSDLLITKQGFLLLKTTSGRWGLLSPSGRLVVWFNSPEAAQALEKKLRAEKVRQPQIFRQ